MCERPDAGVMAIDRCIHGNASSLRAIKLTVLAFRQAIGAWRTSIKPHQSSSIYA
jgi:hypothetical protein